MDNLEDEYRPDQASTLTVAWGRFSKLAEGIEKVQSILCLKRIWKMYTENVELNVCLHFYHPGPRRRKNSLNRCTLNGEVYLLLYLVAMKHQRIKNKLFCKTYVYHNNNNIETLAKSSTHFCINKSALLLRSQQGVSLQFHPLIR